MTSNPHRVKWKFQGGGGVGGGVSKVNVPSMGSMDIFFWNYTIIDVFSILLTASVLGLGRWLLTLGSYGYARICGSYFLSQVIFISFQLH